jgi:hypothetical protein
MQDSSIKNLKNLARVSGILYLLVIAAGMFAELFVRQALFVSGDALATGNNIQANEIFYRFGFVADLINLICGLPIILFFWVLFRPSHPYLATLSLLFAVIANAVFASNLSNQLQPLLILGNEAYLQVFQPNQLAVLGTVALRIQTQGYAIGLVFFGFDIIILGYLIFKTNYIPKILGILYALAGFAYLINSFVMFLSFKFNNSVFQYVFIPIFIGEFSIALWLLLKRIKEPKID